MIDKQQHEHWVYYQLNAKLFLSNGNAYQQDLLTPEVALEKGCDQYS